MVAKGGGDVPEPNCLYTYISLGIAASSFAPAASCLQPAAIIIAFMALYSSPFSLGWCGIEPKESPLYSYLPTSYCAHRKKQYLQ